MATERAARAARALEIAEFALPFAQGLVKLKNAAGRDVTLTGQEAAAVVEALKLLRKGPRDT